MYFLRGDQLSDVGYDKGLRLWYFVVNGFFIWSTGPGWIASLHYLHQRLTYYFCFYYLPKEGDVVIDIGAGIGEEVLSLSNLVGKHGKILAIEATPRISKALLLLKEKNSLDNTTVINAAINNLDEKIRVEDDIEGYVANTVSNRNSHTSLAIDGITFDSLIKKEKIKRIDFLKVNIEGAEQLLIQGMRDSIVLVRNLAISCHDFRFLKGESEFYRTKDIVTKFLIERDFEINQRSTGDTLVDHIVYARNKKLQG